MDALLRKLPGCCKASGAPHAEAAPTLLDCIKAGHTCGLAGIAGCRRGRGAQAIEAPKLV